MKAVGKIEKKFIYRLLVFNIILVIIVTIIPQLVSFYYTGTIFDNEIDNLNVQTVKQIRRIVDDEILGSAQDFSNSSLTPLLGNEPLTYPMDNDIRYNSTAKLSLFRRLTEIKSHMTHVHSIYLYYLQSNILANQSQIRILGDDEDKGIKLPEWMAEFIKAEKNTDWVYGVDPLDNTPVVAYVTSIPLLAAKEHVKLVSSVNFSIDYMEKVLMAYKTEENGKLFILDGSGKFIAGNYSEITDEDLQDMILIGENIPIDREEGKLRFDLNDKSNVVSYVKSRNKEWTYVSIIPVASYYKKYSELRVMTMVVVGAFLLFNILVSIFLTRKAQKPIISEIADLNEKLEVNKPIIRHNFILSLLTGGLRYEKSTGIQAELISFDLQGSSFLSFTLCINKRDYNHVHDSILLPFQILEKLEHKNEMCDIWAIKDERDYISGVAKFENGVEASAVIDLIKIKVEELAGEDYALGIGNVYRDSEIKVSVSYEEACEALERFFIMPHKRVIVYSDMGTTDYDECEDKYVLPLNEIEGFIRACDEKRFLQVIDRIVSDLETGKYSVASSKNILLDIISVMGKTVRLMGHHASEIYGCDIREQFKLIKNTLEFREWIGKIISVSVEEIVKRRQENSLDVGEKIRLYIEKNLEKDLSLDALSDHIGITPTYLSKVFKNSMGVTFTDYVKEMKMRHAAEQLMGKKLTVQEISLRLGYYSTHHFIRLFKEKYGLTPKQYQRQNT